MTVFKHIITSEEASVRLDRFLTQLNAHYSRSTIQSWIKAGLVFVNGKNEKANYIVKEADVVTWSVKEKTAIELKPENIPLTVVFEDDHLIIVNKQKGLIVHPSESHPTGTLVNALLNHTDKLAAAAGEHRPGIVHRLDKDTSGLLIIAKTDAVFKHLVQQLANRTIVRKYQAIVHGSLKHDQGTIDAPIGRHPKRRHQMAVTPDGKHAVTHFKVIKRFEKYTHVACQLETGRTHQIRVHLSHIGHPIVGEPIYRRKKSFAALGQVLHAYYLSFVHPITEEKVSFTAQVPEYFVETLRKLT